jgi:hypothetical protein
MFRQRSHAHGGDQRSRAPSQKLQVDHMSIASHGAERSSLQSAARIAQGTKLHERA